MAGLTGAMFAFHYRRMFRLLFFGRGLTLIPTILVPTLTTYFGQSTLVLQPLMKDISTCHACLEIRSVCIQAASGFFQPWLLAVLTCAVTAKNRALISIPPFTAIKDWASLMNKMQQKLKFKATGFFVGNLICPMLVFAAQLHCLNKLKVQMAEGPKKLKDPEEFS